ncbi:MAG: hypothetical protein ACO31I_06620 [Prochlorotrichaceae cyanobacterium]
MKRLQTIPCPLTHPAVATPGVLVYWLWSLATGTRDMADRDCGGVAPQGNRGSKEILGTEFLGNAYLGNEYSSNEYPTNKYFSIKTIVLALSELRSGWRNHYAPT